MKKTNQKIKKKINVLLILFILSLGALKAQTPNSVGIGTTNPDNSALLHLESSNQGFLMTRLTTPQITAILTPTVGLIIYNTSDQCYWYKRPTYWARLCNTDSINAQNVITNTFTADTTFINVNNFGNGYGDSIWVHYADIDTAIIHNLTVNTINADSIFLGGNSITTVITDSIKSLAWLLKGNSGTNPIINFLGTIDNQDLVIRTNNIENARITSTGNLGVGVVAPTSKLEVLGNTKTTNFQMTASPTNNFIMKSDAVGNGSWSNISSVLTATALNGSGWTILGNTGTAPSTNFLGTIDNQDFVIRTNNTEKMRVTNTGSVGVGTNAPTSKMEIIGNTKTTNFQMTSGATNSYILQSNAVGSGSWTAPASVVSVLTPTVFNSNAWTLLGNSVTNPTVNFLGTTDNQRMVFRTNNTEKVTILPTGEMGVGVVAPTNKLEVAGNTKTTNFQMTTAPTNNFIMKSDAAGNGSWANISSVLTATTLNGSGWTILGNTGTTPAVNFLGTIDNQDLVIRTNNTEKIRVESTGEVGIGVIAPTSKLEVAGNTKTTNFQMTSGATNAYIMQSDAVGSGSWTPAASVVSVLTPTVFNSNAWTLLGNTGTNPSVNFLGTTDNQRMVFRTNNTEKVTILPTGEMGVGVVAPTNKLEVAGNTKTTNFQMTSGAALDYILKSDAAGTASWTPLAAMVATLAPATFNANAWTLLGNAGTTSTVNFVGTKDLQDLTFRTNNVQRFKITTTGQMQSQSAGSLADPSFSWGGGTGYYMSGGQLQVGHGNYNVMTIGGNLTFQPSFFVGAANSVVGPAAGNVALGGNNTIQNTIFTIALGRNNTYVNPNVNYNQYGNNVMIGNLNTINSETFYTTLLGLNNSCTGINPQSACLGTSCQILHPNATAIGYVAKTFANSCVSIAGGGGVNIYSNNISTTGVALAPGGGAWAAVSDRRLKENIKEISSKTILEKLVSIPVTEWTYLSQKVDTMNKYAPVGIHFDKAPVHIGPMAQDFSEIFGYGEFNDKITSSDIDGVMFAGIQALAEENKELKAKVEKLEKTVSEIEELKKLINELKNR